MIFAIDVPKFDARTQRSHEGRRRRLVQPWRDAFIAPVEPPARVALSGAWRDAFLPGAVDPWTPSSPRHRWMTVGRSN
jgi:hypothetical protein